MAIRKLRRIKAVAAAKARRKARGQAATLETEWFVDELIEKIRAPLSIRIKVATEIVRDAVVKNISRPVTKTQGKGGVVVTNRSKKGEYPKADTTILMKSIFGEVKQPRPGLFLGYIGTPLDYGLILEISPKLDRRFLRKTLDEKRALVDRILAGPIK